MAFQEGHSIVRPPLFEGNDFSYWKGRMKYFLMCDFKNWVSVVKGYEDPLDQRGAPIPIEDWTKEMYEKAQANSKAITTIQCGLSMEQFNKIGPFNTAKELWDKLTELNEGSTESRRAKRDLLINQIQTFSMKPSENVSQMHGRFKEIVNQLHVIGEKIDNRDLIRYVLNSFPRTSLWVSIVDAYKVSKDLSIIKLDELFCEFQLHEQTNAVSKEKSLALFVEKKEKKKKKEKEVYSSSSESEHGSSSEDELSASEVAHYVKKFAGRSRKFTKRDVKRMFQSSKGKPTSSSFRTNVVCYGCNKKGHIKPDCPELKKKEEKEKKKKEKKEKKKEAMVAQATWDDEDKDSSDEELCHITRHMAFMAIGDEEESNQEGSSSSSEEASSSDDDEVKDSPEVDFLYKTIAYLKNALNRSKSKVKSLRLELSTLKDQSSLCNDACLFKLDNEKLKDEVCTLKTSLEKFTNGSKYLNMIIGSQRAVYNKAGIGYKSKEKEVAYVSLINRKSTFKGKVRKAWVPKRFLVDDNSSSVWVPKAFVFRVV